MIEFRKAEPFQGPLEQPKATLREASLQAIRLSAAEGTGMQYTFYRDHRLPIETPRGQALAKVQGIEPVFVAGEKTFEEWLADKHAQSAKGYSMMWDCRSGDPGLLCLDVYDVTKDAKYLEAAKRLAAAWRDTQLPSGTWPPRQPGHRRTAGRRLSARADPLVPGPAGHAVRRSRLRADRGPGVPVDPGEPGKTPRYLKKNNLPGGE